MKKIIFITIFITFNFLPLFAQTGIYQSSHYSFVNSRKPSASFKKTENRLLIVDLDSPINNHVTFKEIDSESGDEIFVKWKIIGVKDKTRLNKETNTIETLYHAKVELIGIELDDEIELFVSRDLKNNTLGFMVNNLTNSTTYFFFNAKKI